MISVIVPTLDEEERLAGLLADVRGAEIVVVDGGSSDGTLAVARAAGATVVVAPRGRGTQLAAGVEAARGDRLWFLHADVRIDPGAVSAVEAAAGPWGCFAVRFDVDDPRLRFTAAWMNARARRSGAITGDMGIWVDRSLYDDLGGFPPLASFEDLVFTDRARRVVRPQVLLPPLVLSARRWVRRGYARTTLEHWGLRGAYRLGVPPSRLASLYR